MMYELVGIRIGSWRYVHLRRPSRKIGIGKLIVLWESPAQQCFECSPKQVLCSTDFSLKFSPSEQVSLHPEGNCQAFSSHVQTGHLCKTYSFRNELQCWTCLWCAFIPGRIRIHYNHIRKLTFSLLFLTEKGSNICLIL